MASLGAVTMLIIEFILGMIYNLYGTAPTAAKSVGLFSSPVLALHVIMSLLLLISAVMLLVRAIGARHGLTIWLSAAGLAGITIVTVNPALRPQELAYVLGQSQADGIFLVPAYRASSMAESSLVSAQPCTATLPSRG